MPIQIVVKALGQFRRAPGYTIAVTLSLALGVAAACAAFAIVKRALFDPLPYPQPDRIVTVRTMVDGEANLATPLIVAEHLRTSPMMTVVSADWGRTVTYEVPGASERLTAGDVTPEYFDVLGVQPVYGNAFRAGEFDAVLLSWQFFERVLAANPAAVGTQITIDSIPRRIVGVMPEGFLGPYLSEAGIWLPLDMRPLAAEQARVRRNVIVQARLADDVSIEQARAYVSALSEQLKGRYPQAFARQTLVVDRLQDAQVEPSRTLLIAIAAASALLMLIVVTNIAGLAAARAGELRQAEAIRLALGATSTRLFRERLIESLVLAGVGTATGIWLCGLAVSWTTDVAASQQLLMEDVPHATLDAAVVAFGVVLGIITGLVTALVPHRSAGHVGADELLGSARGFSGTRLARTRAALVVAQVAIAVVLLVSAGLLVRTVRSITSTSIGFASDKVVIFGVMLPTARYNNPARIQQFEGDVLGRVQRVPGVEAATATSGFPTLGGPEIPFTIQGQPAADAQRAVYFVVAPDFFSFLQLPVVAGRDMKETDTAAAPHVVVVNETMARRYWPSGSAVGSLVRIAVGSAQERDARVVGIVPDVRQDGPAREVRPTVFASIRQAPSIRFTFAVRISRPLGAVSNDIRSAVVGADPLLPMPAPIQLDRRLESQNAQQRFFMSVLTVFGAIAAGLCALGLYAVVSLNAHTRRREFAVRMALGAQYRQVGWLVLRQAVWLGTAGAAVGLAASFAITGTLQALLHGVDRMDPFTLAAAMAGILAVAVAASLAPALRAARIDPVTVLKSN